MDNLNNKKDYIDVYQIIRGGACLFVAINHYAFFNKYGYGKCGVEFFVIISGLLTALNAEKHNGLKTDYLLRKVIKLLPLYWLLTILIFAIGLILPNIFSSLKFNFENLVYSMCLIPGHTFYLYPGWTLTYFLVFYVVYFAADRLSNHRDITATIIIIAFVIIGKITNLFWPENIISNYANPLLLEFMYGVVLFHILKFKQGMKQLTPKSAYFILLVIVIILFFDSYLGKRYLLPAILSSVAITLFYESYTGHNMVTKMLKEIGDISYVVYLFHPLIIRPIDKILLKLFETYNLLYFIGVLVSLIICIAICKAITTPLKKLHFLG